MTRQWLTRAGLERLLFKVSLKRDVQGIPVAAVVGWLDRDEAERQFAVIDNALGLVRRTSPAIFARIYRDIHAIFILGHPAIYARFSVENKWCELNGDWLLEPDASPVRVAATIIHEATHGRLHRLGLSYEQASRAQVERICCKAERNFALRLPPQEGKPLLDECMDRVEWDEAMFTDAAIQDRQVWGLQQLGYPEWLAKYIGRRGARRTA